MTATVQSKHGPIDVSGPRHVVVNDLTGRIVVATFDGDEKYAYKLARLISKADSVNPYHYPHSVREVKS